MRVRAERIKRYIRLKERFHEGCEEHTEAKLYGHLLDDIRSGKLEDYIRQLEYLLEGHK